MAQEHTPISGPRGIPLLGNIYDIEKELPLRSLESLADNYGEIFRLSVLGEPRYVISSHELVDEVCNEERFTKKVSAGLNEIRNGVHDGLFTARYGEENWAVAHRALMPAFGPLAIRGMFDDMYDLATQLVMKWARQGSKTPIAVTDDFTRLTLDTIALCGMGTRFNSFYQKEMHPFVDAMLDLLKGSGERASRLTLMNNLPTAQNTQYWNHIAYMRQFCEDIVEDRKSNPEDKKDLLNAIIFGKDPQTGKGLTHQSIIDNMITFLIAGHETTSGMLSFIFYYLLTNPPAYQKAQEEVDRVVGRRKIAVEDLAKLPYINAVMREALRLRSTAPAFALYPHPEKNTEDPVTLGNGKYVVGKNDPIIVLLSKLHRDPKVWGEDAEEFRPERMLDEHFEKLPRNSWKPFGNGMRGCIGRPFAWQEAQIVIAILLQNFNFQMQNPSYTLNIKQTLTIKPKDFEMRATLREGLNPSTLSTNLSSGVSSDIQGASSKERTKQTQVGKGKPMYIYYGSNTGTCEALAQRLADDALGHGFAPDVETLDSARQNIPKDGPVILVSASYEGQPPDNAAHFFEWLSGLKESDALRDVNYAVFGCGHHDWQATFYRVPKMIDQMMDGNGGSRICDAGFADAASGDMFTSFDTWGESKLWPAISTRFGGSKTADSAKAKAPLMVEASSGTRPSTLGFQLQEATVVSNDILTKPDVPAKRTIKFRLPSEVTYQCGDYLAVLPVNPTEVVRRAIRRFGLPWDAILRIQKGSQMGGSPVSIPLDTPISVFDLFSTYVELSQPASKRDVDTFAEAASTDEHTQSELRSIAASPTRFSESIVARRVSPLDLLVHYPAIDISIGAFLTLLPPMRTRQYSISSSPLPNPSECSITFSVLNSRSEGADSQQLDDLGGKEPYLGVASTYLETLQHEDRAHVNVRPSHTGFKPPNDLETPMIMACAGSGLAPFRGFVMDRYEQICGGHSSKIAKVVLYIGCRTQGKDDIHADELEEWQRKGAVDVRWAYSRPADGSKGQHVQDRIMEDREELVELFRDGARLYVCGNTGVGNAVREAFRNIYLEQRREKRRVEKEQGTTPVDDQEDEDTAVENFFQQLRAKQRYVTDVFT